MSCACETLAPQGLELSPACLGHLWVFQDLAAEVMGELMERAFRRALSPDETVFHQGDPAREVMVLKAGRVKLTKVFEDGRQITLDLRKAGDFLGETVFAEDAEYPLSAVYLDPTLVCGFTRETFESIVMAHPAVGLQVIRNLSRRISWLTDRAGSLSAGSLEERLFGLLRQVGREHGTPGDDGVRLDIPLTHEELGFLVGAHRVSVTRAIKSLRESGRLAENDDRRFFLPGNPNFDIL
ncbi:MAG: Crp/Fnr family transcriptional regulator [Thermodesulfobacteriota bacterium]